MANTKVTSAVIADGAITPSKIASGDFYFDTDTLYIDSANNRVGIGTADGVQKLTVVQDDSYTDIANGYTNIELANTNGTNGTYSRINCTDTVGGAASVIIGAKHIDTTNNYGQFEVWTRGSSGFGTRMIVDSSGNLLVGNTVVNPASGFGSIKGFGYEASTGKVEIATTANDAVMEIGKNNSNNGNLLVFRQVGSILGTIGVKNLDMYIGTGDTNLRFQDSSDYIAPADGTGGARDGVIDLGLSGGRFADIYATNGTIQTSDRNEKQDEAELTDAETRVAVAAKGLLRKFRWQSAVEEKGDEARIHFGIIAQDLQDAFTAEGLDASDYAMFISSTWTDEETGEERTRLGVRYSELLAFIIAGI